MKKYTVLAASSFVLVLLFQNCGKPPGNSENSNLTGVSASNQQYNKYSVGNFSTLSLWDFLNGRFLDLNMQTGEIAAFDEGGQVPGQVYQLPPEKLS